MPRPEDGPGRFFLGKELARMRRIARSPEKRDRSGAGFQAIKIGAADRFLANAKRTTPRLEKGIV